MNPRSMAQTEEHFRKVFNREIDARGTAHCLHHARLRTLP
jgi:hypothetical protein